MNNATALEALRARAGSCPRRSQTMAWPQPMNKGTAIVRTAPSSGHRASWGYKKAVSAALDGHQHPHSPFSFHLPVRTSLLHSASHHPSTMPPDRLRGRPHLIDPSRLTEEPLILYLTHTCNASQPGPAPCPTHHEGILLATPPTSQSPRRSPPTPQPRLH
ncbi:hypothetical protein C8Q79DRAFT_767311 [Trametes meyenii]|nr:hypothetical protein C8Q79DRAFT_767311 [Trametes meyenii]